jgi:F-type H+-transporting ATPase subunit epsilon
MPIKITVVTAEQRILEDVVDMVVAPGIEGQLGILPRHAPLLTPLQAGELRLKKGGTETSLVVSGGFLEVRPDEVTVLADAAERAEEIDLARAEEAMKRAQERIKTHAADLDLERANAALRRASVRIKIARRRSGSGAPRMGA